MTLVLEFEGWCLLRLPTDPDPSDEPRGVSGYTFAFAGEPDLDRVLHLQPPSDFTPRSHSPELGVRVRSAVRTEPGGAAAEVPSLVGAAVDLLERPIIENRNWTLTLPGFEPIVPFHMRIAGDGIVLDRRAPLNPADPDQPLWETSEALLAAQGARGMEFEPATIGEATGIWDSAQLVADRHAALAQELAALERDGAGESAGAVALRGRLAELEVGVKDPRDRRVMARMFVERFGFPMQGEAVVEGDQATELGGAVDLVAPWTVNFWLGAWDPDLLCLYCKGALCVPYASA